MKARTRKKKGNFEAKKNSGGFTLIELLVAIAIGTAIVGVMSMSIASMMKITTLNTDRAVVLQQVQNAGYWITRDVGGSCNVTAEPEAGVLVRMQQKEGYPTVTREVQYVFFDDGDGITLRRQVDGAEPGMLIAQYVVSDNTSFVKVVSSNSTYQLIVGAAKGEAELQRIYDAYQRYVAE